jgi:4-amino-4-deoxy-L-arabinose transferase-like glycosyltransferase
MGLAACLGAAFLAMLVWAEEPGLKQGAIFGFCMALALLSKFTTLGFFPVGAAIALAFYLAAERPGMQRLKRMVQERMGSCGLAVVVCCLHMWAYFSHSLAPF